MTSAYIAPALCAAGWTPPLEIVSKIVIRRRRGRVYVVLKFEGHVRVVHVASSCPFAVRVQLDDACMSLMMESDYQPSALDIAGQTFEANVAGMGGRHGS